MSIADKIEKMTTVEFELLWTRGNAIVRPAAFTLNSLVKIDWESLHEQTVLFLEKWEKENGKS